MTFQELNAIIFEEKASVKSLEAAILKGNDHNNFLEAEIERGTDLNVLSLSAVR